MTKKEAISIISRCAKQYASDLCDKQLAFIYRDSNNKPAFVEVVFRSNNFLHFTGVETRNHLKANAFYRDAIEQRLKEANIIFRDNHTTELKLEILHSIMNIAYSARMIGNYTGPRLDLYTEKVTGTTSACLGLIKNSHEYIPNTVLKEDIRNITPRPSGKIFAIFRKSINSKKYTELTYQSKTITITRKCLPEELLTQIEPSLLKDDNPAPFAFPTHI